MNRIATILVAAAALSACSSDPAPNPAETTDRLAVIAGLRAIDVCALYGATQTVDGRPLTVLGFGSPLNCEATVDDSDRPIDATIALNIGPAQPVGEEPSWVRHAVIDGVDVSITSSDEQPDAPPREDMVASSCEFAASYPDNARLTVRVSADPDVDGCAIAQSLMNTAMSAYKQRPKIGTSGLPSTVLSGADPCEPAERLRATRKVDISPADVTVNSCMFTVDDESAVDVSFSYKDPAMLDVSFSQLTIDGHRVVGDDKRGVYDVVVGEPVDGARGRVVPLVSVVGPAGSNELVLDVALAVAEMF